MPDDPKKGSHQTGESEQQQKDRNNPEKRPSQGGHDMERDQPKREEGGGQRRAS